MSLSRCLASLFALILCIPAWAQNPVKWSATLEPTRIRAGEGGRLVLRAKIEAPWYIYAPTTPSGGPIATKIEMAASKAVILSGKIAQPAPKKHFDEGFQMQTETFSKEVAFGLPVKIKAGTAGQQKATIQVLFQTCNQRMCLPPKTVQVPFSFTIAPGVARADKVKPDSSVPTQATQVGSQTPPTAPKAQAGAKPANDTAALVQRAEDRGILAFAGFAFISGLLALLTPCVFPMIPITVSFFTKNEKGGLAAPIAYCVGIVGTFTALGIAVSALFGASGLTLFAANPYVNIALATLFVLLAFNLFGVFEIIVPAALINRFSPTSKSGLIAPLLMGFAFTLTSFTCTVPFVGTALVAAASGSALYPLVGMLAFSTAFALPFFLLALFPGWLAKLPRSGAWLVSVKAFMGFLELAAALKFLSTSDMVWQMGWLTRPVFLALWFALAILAALYLWKWVRLPKDDGAKAGPVRYGIGLATFGVAGALLMAMNGAKLGEFDAYLPPLDYGKSEKIASLWLKNDLETAQRRAKELNKPLLINFTGYACTNCRLMENNVLPHPDVLPELANFVAVELYTDGTDAQSHRFNQYQQQKFGTVAIPLYAVVEPDGQIRGRLEGLERDPQKFAAFLEQSRNGNRVAREE